MNNPIFNIAVVERDTGLSKDVLRMWERRYGFPLPERDANGERLYPATQVERLRLIKRLMDQGHRPGRLIALADDELMLLAPRRPRNESDGMIAEAQNGLEELLALVRQHDASAYQQALQHRLVRQGLQTFVLDTIAPLTRLVGEAWEDGRIEVFEEHLFTELTKRVMRQAIATVTAPGNGPRILLTTVPEEPHVLGLLMVEALFSLEGATCIPLGTQMPLFEIVRAAEAHRADIVALSFSVAFPQRKVPGLLQQLRGLLPRPIELWAGGTGTTRLGELPGIRRIGSLDGAIAAISEWSGDAR